MSQEQNARELNREKEKSNVGTEASLCRMTSDELEKHFDTDVAVGLSPSQARKRLVKRNPLCVFSVEGRRISAWIKDMFLQPSIWILLAVSLIAILFEYYFTGIFTALLTILHGVFCAVAASKNERTDESLGAIGDAPLARVLRGGKIYRIREEELVVGDIVILYEGDIVAADMRLVSASSLEVEELIAGRARVEKDSNRAGELLKKHADPIQDDIVSDRVISPDNTVYAGDIIRKGEARAVVTAVGEDTHIYATKGRVLPLHTPPHLGKTPDSVSILKKYFSVYSLISAVLIIPIVIIGVLTAGNSGETAFFDIVLLALSVGAASTGARIIPLVEASYTSERILASRERDAEIATDIKGERELDRLSSMTDLVVLGSAALHDGIPHPEWVITAENRYNCSDRDTDGHLALFSENLYLLSLAGLYDADKEHLLRQVSDGLSELAALDRDSLGLRIENIESVRDGNGIGYGHITFKNREERCLRASFDLSAIEYCSSIRGVDGVAVLDRDTAEKYISEAKRASRAGYGSLAIIGGERGDCLEGIIFYSSHTSRKTRGILRSLEDRGVRVLMFDTEESYETDRVLIECGFADIASEIYHESRAREELLLHVSDGENDVSKTAADGIRLGIKAFLGVSKEYINDYITYAKENGGTVGIVTVDGDYLSLFDRADIAITCSMTGLVSRERDDRLLREEQDIRRDSMKESRRASDLMRRRADLLIRRASESGGGLMGIHRAMTSAMRCSAKVSAAIRYLISAQVLRMAFVLIAGLFGAVSISHTAVLLSGMLLDSLVLMAIALSRKDRLQPIRKNGELYLTRLLSVHFKEILATLCSVACFYVSVGITILTGYADSTDMTRLAVAAMFATQLAAYLLGNYTKRTGARRNRVGGAEFAIVAVAVLVTLAAFAWCLISGTSVGLLAVALIQPATLVIATLLINKSMKKAADR